MNGPKSQGNPVTEAEWLACANPSPMLEFLRDKASERKLRVFAVACCRRIWHLFNDEQFRRAVTAAELFADGEINKEELASARAAAISVLVQLHGDDEASGASISAAGIPAPKKPFWEQLLDAFSDPWWEDEFDKGDPLAPAIVTARHAAWAAARRNGQHSLGGPSSEITEQQAQVTILRDIFGNRFHALPPRPEVIAPLAERIYAGEWDKMPLLGEWLQEHGYWSEGEHCLDPKLHHVKGCWVVDWVTGRE